MMAPTGSQAGNPASNVSTPQVEAIIDDKPHIIQDFTPHPGPSTEQDTLASPNLGADCPPKSTKPAQPSSDLMFEIRALREKLLHLEERAANELDLDPEDSGGEGDVERADPSEDEKKLRKQIRRARFSKKWVQKSEERAEKTKNDRIALEIMPPFMHQIGKDGQVLDGVRDFYYDANPDGVSHETNREHDEWVQDKFDRRSLGLRPPTSLRPNSSRKLGPPTQWDTSDSDEWTSDDSTRSRDFDYFRARLRGDFEWELDRLRAQKERYEKHKEKKKAQELALAEQEARKRRQGVDTSGVDGLVDQERPSGTHPLPSLNPIEWHTFKDARSRFAIDVLIGEPQISVDVFWRYGGGRAKARAGGQPAGTLGGNPKQSGEAAVQTSAPRDGQAPLPERIRIRSKQLMKTLEVIQGSEIGPSDDTEKDSIVMLRPFRMLTYYEGEIRKWQSRLEERLRKTELGSDKVATAVEPVDELSKLFLANAAHAETEQRDKTQEETPKVPDPEGYSISEVTLEHLPCLLEFMDQYISKKVAHLNSPRCDKIFFSDIWHLFKPGDFAISAHGRQAYQVVNVTSSRHIGTDRWSWFTMQSEDPKRRKEEIISIRCVYIHFNGNELGPVSETFSIKKFDGERAVTALEIYPLRFHVLKHMDAQTIKSKQTGAQLEEAVAKGVASLRRTLIDRGRRFIEVAGVKHMYYAGLTVDTHDEVESQVIVDFEEAFTVEKNNEWRPDLTRLVGATTTEGSLGNNEACKAACCLGEFVHDDFYVEHKRHQDFINKLMDEIENNMEKLPSAAIFPRSLENIKTGANALTEDELLIMSYCVFGFVLRDRSWAQLDLAYLTDISGSSEDVTAADGEEEDEEDKTAFGRLVLPEGHREMVLSLISQHFRNKISQKDREEQVDIVRGKGKGLIVLLHGAPGVGKTTTAEGVAERFKKPLFQITCGDLGSTAKDVEAALQMNFALANRWGCILLLDEADVFLAERRRDDFIRNGLVAVFLRVLEYYAGILFLTTNRIGDFDEAFASRIHMSLHYPPLDRVSTVKVFKLNLGMIRARYKEAGRRIKIDDDEILEIARDYWQQHEKARWNGRQIRNACQTALALAEFDAQPAGSKYDLKVRSDAKVHLSVKNLQTVSNAYLEFMEYLRAVHGTDAETHANEAGVRAIEAVFSAIKAGKSVRGMYSGQTSERRENSLHKFKLPGYQTQPSFGSTTQPEQRYTPQHRREGSHDSAQHSMEPRSASQHVADPRSGIPSYGQPTSVPGPSYTQHPGSGQAHRLGGPQHLPVPQHGSYSPSIPTTASQHHFSASGYTAGGESSAGVVPMYDQGGSSQQSGAYSERDPRLGSP
ncbi:hypothetical protein B0T10DRAFT_588244 [Thelonectria olida]|uniref:AAA+ ATPase domain-containing protein n=1 Tax=Thelonectria olida TaxID=1576542 RepID=A0A9P8VS61_9HYPO|nr:hypothetical protein B0T10DRAFT_588244 [Thelonectria olida]